MKRNSLTKLRTKQLLPGKEKSSTLNTEKKTEASATSFDEEENFTQLEKEFFAPPQKKPNLLHLFGKFLLLIIQAVTALFLFPLMICTVILAALFGIEIYLVITGSSLLGIALITLSLIGLIQLSTSLIWKLVRQSKRKLRTYGIHFLIFVILFGTGTVLSIYEFSHFSIQNSPLYAQDMFMENINVPLTNQAVTIDAGSSQIEISTNDSIEKDTMMISYTAPNVFHLKEIEKDRHYAMQLIQNSSELIEWIQEIISTTFTGLHENILYQYQLDYAIHITIQVHPSMLHRIETQGNQVILHESAY